MPIDHTSYCSVIFTKPCLPRVIHFSLLLSSPKDFATTRHHFQSIYLLTRLADLKTLEKMLALIALAWEILCNTQSSRCCSYQLFAHLSQKASRSFLNYLSSSLIFVIFHTWSTSYRSYYMLQAFILLWPLIVLSSFVLLLFLLPLLFITLHNSGVNCISFFLPFLRLEFLSPPHKHRTPTLLNLNSSFIQDQWQSLLLHLLPNSNYSLHIQNFESP